MQRKLCFYYRKGHDESISRSQQLNYHIWCSDDLQNEGKDFGNHTSTDKEQNQGYEEFKMKVELAIPNCTEKLNKQKENMNS